MIINCIIIDFLSQYRYGLEASESDKFKEFFSTYLGGYNFSLKPSITSCYCYKNKWQKIEITDIANALYHGFRCGLLHSGRILEYGRINELHKEPVRAERWLFKKSK